MSSLDKPTVLIYGQSGIGKTAAAVRAFKRNAFWICTERGALATALDTRVNPSREVPDHVECLSLDAPFDEVWSVALKACDLVRKGRYKVLVVDTLSTLADREYDKIVESGEAPESYGKASRLLAGRIQRLVGLAMATGAVFCATAHEREQVSFDGSTKPGGPKLPGKLIESVPSLFSLVLRCKIIVTADGERKRVFFADELDSRWTTKDRYGVVRGERDMDLYAVLTDAVKHTK